MRKLDRTIRTIAEKDVSVCFIGESGTGKEVLARHLHELSSRRAAPFVPINCAAIPEQLIESELFGHEKGAFTGANTRTRGKVEAAEGGTLFLDEIAEMPVPMQAKVLRFLENRKFMRVGGSSKIDMDVRIVCATLQPLEVEVGRGRFRADLFYRIQGLTLTIPALRDRRADIPPLVRQLLDVVCTQHRVAAPRLGRAVMAAILAYEWPGNVRELRNVLERIAILRGGKRVRLGDLPEAIRARVQAPGSVERSSPNPTIQVSLGQTLDETIDQVICAAVELEGGNKSRAAERLGIGLRTVQRHFARRTTAVPGAV